MATQKALWLPKIGAEFTLGKNEIPKPGPGEVLVKLEASALNPLDVDIQKWGFFEIKGYPIVLGEDGASVVQKVGNGVTNLAQGDKVFFQTSLGNKTSSFQEYCLVIAVLAVKIPSNLSFDQATSVSVAFNPFAVATYAEQPQGIALTPPFEEGLLLSLGATHVLNRKLSGAALKKRVGQLVTVPVTYIFDAVSLKETQQAAYDLLAPGGTLVVVSEPQVGGDEDKSRKKFLMVPGVVSPTPESCARCQVFDCLDNVVEGGEDQGARPNHVEVLQGGLNSVVGGLKRLAGGVSATRLIVRRPETTDS